MGTFAKLVQGPRQRFPVELPLSGARMNAETGKWDGAVDVLDMRPLRPDQHALVLQGAREYALAHGVKDPYPTDDLYERGRMLHTLALACVDHDAPAGDPDPKLYFTGVKEISESEIMTPELVAYLFQRQARIQDDCSPLQGSLSPAEFVHAVLRTVSGEDGDIGFFDCMRPGTQWSFVLTMARLLASSTTLDSLSTSRSDTPQATNEE